MTKVEQLCQLADRAIGPNLFGLVNLHAGDLRKLLNVVIIAKQAARKCSNPMGQAENDCGGCINCRLVKALAAVEAE